MQTDPLRQLQILLLENSEADKDLLERYLSRGGLTAVLHQVFSQKAMEEALDSRAWDLILSDYNMPGFDAFRALDLLKARKLRIPLLIVSGAIGEEVAVELMKAGADDYVMKSNLARLIPAIERSLREAALRKREEESRVSAERAVKEREDMLAIVSHDLKNPLGAIRLNHQLIMRFLRTGNLTERELKIQNQVERASRSAERMLGLIGDIMDVPKIEAGRFVVEKKLNRPDELVSEVMDLYQPLAMGKSILIEAEFMQDNISGQYDHVRIFQVISNCLGNAIKFTPERGKIVLRVSESSSEVQFAISDSGHGIAPKNQSQIFDRFWQAKNSDHQGIGLGLSIAKGIVDAHGGRIWVESQLSIGSTFYFTLPKSK